MHVLLPVKTVFSQDYSDCSMYSTRNNSQYSYPHKNSQAVKNSATLKRLGEKSCEIKGGGQEMAAMMFMLINFNNAHSHY